MLGEESISEETDETRETETESASDFESERTGHRGAGGLFGRVLEVGVKIYDVFKNICVLILMLI